MLKLLVGFGTIIFVIALIGLAIYFISQDDKDEKKEHEPIEPTDDVLKEISQCMRFFLSIPNLGKLSQGIVSPLEKIAHIIERYPDKSQNLQELTGYIIPLAKKLADDYCFHKSHGKDGKNSARVMETCEEGLKSISHILYKKADSMLEDKFYDIHADVAVFMQMHPESELKI